MPQNNQTLLEKTVADQWQTLPSGLTVIVRPMPGYLQHPCHFCYPLWLH